MGHGCQTTLVRSSWPGSRSTSHHFCQREGNFVIGNFTRIVSLDHEVSTKGHLANSQAMSARLMTTRMRRRPMQTILGQDWGNVARSEKILHHYSKYYRYKFIEKLASLISHLWRFSRVSHSNVKQLLDIKIQDIWSCIVHICKFLQCFLPQYSPHVSQMSQRIRSVRKRPWIINNHRRQWLQQLFNGSSIWVPDSGGKVTKLH